MEPGELGGGVSVVCLGEKGRVNLGDVRGR